MNINLYTIHNQFKGWIRTSYIIFLNYKLILVHIYIICKLNAPVVMEVHLAMYVCVYRYTYIVYIHMCIPYLLDQMPHLE